MTTFSNLWQAAGRHLPRRRALAAITAAAFGLVLGAMPPLVRADDGQDGRGKESHWVGTWAASPQSVDAFTPANPASFDGQTIRQVVHASIGGQKVRVRFTNEFGAAALEIGAAHVALQSTDSSIVAGSDRVLTFAGQNTVSVPKGAPMVSDPVDLAIPPLGNLVITIYLPGPTHDETFHALGRQSTYVSGPGNFAAALAFPTVSTTQSWYFISAVDVLPKSHGVAVVTLGDSITDGFACTVDANRRWPNVLAERLQASERYEHIAVLDEGISGNRVLHDIIGPNALSRVDRDVLAASGVKYVTLLEGINDIGFSGFIPGEAVSASDIIAGYRQIISRVHAKGLLIYGCTLTPFGGLGAPYETPAGEVKRQAVNQWIRTSHAFDAVIDFDRVVRDPANPTHIRAAFDSGDHLHPNDLGYRAMAESIDLGLFTRDAD
ncbi:MAG: SGNH/GDSL hydrolase family protein [Pseudomonadota bacterium]|nr:SGNH/GDSL hydrolase family protein [Pseudomonadota bacterium]